MWDIFYLEFTSTLEKHYFIQLSAEMNTINQNTNICERYSIHIEIFVYVICKVLLIV